MFGSVMFTIMNVSILQIVSPGEPGTLSLELNLHCYSTL